MNPSVLTTTPSTSPRTRFQNGPQYQLGAILTVPELADALRVSIKTVRDWTYKRTVPFTKLRGRVYFSKELIEGLLAEGARAPFADGGSVQQERKEVADAR